MRRQVFLAIFFFLASVQPVFAADVWKYAVTDAQRNSDNTLRLNLVLKLNSAEYATLVVDFNVTDFNGLTANQKLTLADNAIKARCAPIISAYNLVQGALTWVGTDRDAQ